MQSAEAIKREIIRRINDRVWQPGEVIPGELELAREFGCARTTVNRALQEIANRGLVNRRRKAGTRVALNPVRRATLEIPIVREEIERTGAAYRHKLLHCSREHPPAAKRREWAPGNRRKMLHLQALHLADDKPWVYEDRWINVAEVPAILDVDLKRISANEWLVQNAPFTRGDLAISATSAEPAEVQALGLPLQSALLRVDRQTWSDDALITSVALLYSPGYAMRSVL